MGSEGEKERKREGGSERGKGSEAAKWWRWKGKKEREREKGEEREEGERRKKKDVLMRVENRDSRKLVIDRPVGSLFFFISLFFSLMDFDSAVLIVVTLFFL